MHFDPVVDQCKHLTFTFARRVSGEFGRANTLGNVEPHIVGGLGPRTLPSRARALFLRGHRGFKASGINAETLGAQGVFGQIIGEAKGIVELERGFARQRIAGLHSRCSLIQKLQTFVECPAELRLFLIKGRLDQLLSTDQFGICSAHFGHQIAHQPVHQRLFRP